jgi:putative intracellular protease/amidase
MAEKHRPHVLVPLPDHDFDPTESATPWRECHRRGWKSTFASENGAIPAADPRLLMGLLRGPLGPLPGGLADYEAMARCEEYQRPIRYDQIRVEDYDAILLTGGHAPGMKQFLESKILQEKVVDFFRQGKGVGAICHGVVLLARSIDPATGRSVIHDYRVTALTKFLEMNGYALTFWRFGRRFRTYDAYVADEVRAALSHPAHFTSGWIPMPHVVEDRNLVTARYWMFDNSLYSRCFADMVEKRMGIQP